MKSVVLALLVAGLCLGSASAQDLGNSRELPAKNTPVVIYEPPAVPKQGGDTIGDATVIPGLPYTNTGTTAGYNDDYDEACPYVGSTAPDVVYSFTPVSDVPINVDLCGSSYDTKTYIYDDGLNLVACNDDAYFDDDVCGNYVSKIEDAALMGGNTYFIVIDGYGGEAGNYELLVEVFEPCFVYCPEDAVPEGEPFPELIWFDDFYNSGCGSPDGILRFQPINWTNDEDGVPPYDGYAWLCGKSGWHYDSAGMLARDTDWFSVFALETGVMECTLQSEFPCHIFKLAPLDCENIEVELNAEASCQAPATLSFPVTVGEEVWLWVGPTDFSGPYGEFTYFMTLSNNAFDTVPNEGISWGGLKALYR